MDYTHVLYVHTPINRISKAQFVLTDKTQCESDIVLFHSSLLQSFSLYLITPERSSRKPLTHPLREKKSFINYLTAKSTTETECQRVGDSAEETDAESKSTE